MTKSLSYISSMGPVLFFPLWEYQVNAGGMSNVQYSSDPISVFVFAYDVSHTMGHISWLSLVLKWQPSTRHGKHKDIHTVSLL